MSGASPPPGAAEPIAAIPLEGLLFDGIAVRVGWPVPGEYDRITALRNRDAVRERFVDPRPLDLAANRRWLAHGMRRPTEAVLSIRLAHDDSWVGAIGWSAYDPIVGVLELGRMMVDVGSVRAHRARFPAGYPGVGVDASSALRDFVFARMGVNRVTMAIMTDNALSRRAARFGGARPVGEREVQRADGSRVTLLDLAMTRDEWLALPRGVPSPDRK